MAQPILLVGIALCALLQLCEGVACLLQSRKCLAVLRQQRTIARYRVDGVDTELWR